MAKKIRIQLSAEEAAEILFASNRICCKCNAEGKQVQIHHIDDDPSNNEIENLAVLCFECHNETLIKGGFGRQLSKQQVIKYRDHWHSIVKEKRILAASNAQSEYSESLDQISYKNPNHYDDFLLDYVNRILEIQKGQILVAKANWSSSSMDTMNKGSEGLIEFYEEVLVELATYYPKGHFDNRHPRSFINELVHNKARWHGIIAEPGGENTGGQLVRSTVRYRILEDLKNMISEMVYTLLVVQINEDRFDFNKWNKKWKS